MSNNRITPFVKRMRINGGTIYTFSSAVEDIGLNINERNNIVKISHFALLNIPPIQQLPSLPTNLNVNRFNVTNIAGAFGYEQGNPSIKDGRVLIAESFENYALNLESNILNKENYNPTLIRTVSERVFWKWLKETGAIRWSKDVSIGGNQYWTEEIDSDGSLGYNSVVKYIGQISAGNVRTDSFGTYNETYILVPTSHGQMSVYFKIVEDDNYYHGMRIEGLGENILGRENYTLPHPDGLSYLAYYDFVDSSTQIISPDGTWTLQYDDSTGTYSNGWWYTPEGLDPVTKNSYLIDSSSYLSTGIYNTNLRYSKGGNTVEFKRSKIDCLSLVFDLDDLKSIYADSELTYDKMAIQYSINDSFEFNAVLIYYTVWDSTGSTVLGRNLLGVLFIDAPSGNSSNIPLDGILIPALEKIQSSPSGFGTSYSLRLNIKTDNMVDDTNSTVVDMATSDQLYAEDWTEAFANLNTAVNLLTQNTSVIQNISEKYREVQSVQTQILNDIQSLQYTINDIGRDIHGTANTLALFADGDDPLVDSSVYMRFGNVGIKNPFPEFPLHVIGETKLDDVIIENAIRDVSNNILLGYGSPLQLGSSTNYREIDIYTGNPQSSIHIDTSNNMILRGDVSVSGNLVVDGSAILKYLYVDNISSSSFDFNKSYINDSSIGTQFQWENGYLKIIASSDVSAAGVTGNIQFNSNGSLNADPSLTWNSSLKRLGIRTADPSAALHVFGDTIIESLFTASSNLSVNGYITGLLKTDSSVILYSGGNEYFIFNSNDKTFKIGDYKSVGNGGVLDIDGINGIMRYSLDGIAILDASNSSISLYNSGTERLKTDSDGIEINGNINLRSGSSSTISIKTGSTPYSLTIKGQDSNSTSNGGNLYLYGGGSDSGIGGNVYIEGGEGSIENGSVYIGFLETSSIILGNTFNIPIGTPQDNQILYIDTSNGNILKRTSAGISAVTSISNNVNDYILTATGSSTINGESGLRFSGTVLDVSGNIQLSYSSSRTISMTGSPTNGGNLIILGSSGGSGNGGDVILETSGASGNSGNIILRPGIGGSGRGSVYINGDNSTYYGNAVYFYAGNATTERLSLFSTSLDSNVPIKFPASNTYIILLGNDTDSGFRWDNTNRYLYLTSDGTDKFRFDTNGQFDADGNIVAYSSAVSDIRLKNNIKDLESPLEKILQIRGVSYDRKKTGDKHFGVIAQEIENIIPEIVDETVLPLETGDDETFYKTVRYTELIPYLIEAIKEQQKMIDELKREINELKK